MKAGLKKRQAVSPRAAGPFLVLRMHTHLQLEGLDLRDPSKRRGEGNLCGLLSRRHDVNDPRYHGFSELHLGQQSVGGGAG